MIAVVNEKEFNAITKETSNNLYLRLYLSAFKSGLVAEMKPTNFTVLLTICSYMDENGECFPTQQQIADRCGITKTTVNKAVNELLEMEFDGKPVLERKLVKRGQFRNSVYTVNPISQVAIFGGDVDELEEQPEVTEEKKPKKVTEASKGMNARDVVNYFSSVYQTVYGVIPSINWKRDTGMVKNKWIGNYSDEHMKKMIDVAVREYDANWKNEKYTRPSIAALVSWLGEQAYGKAVDAEKEMKDVSEIGEKYVAGSEEGISRLMNRLNK